MNISWWRTSFDDRELERIKFAIDHECISQGTITAEFEEKFASSLNVKHAVAANSGSSCLWMALMSLGIGPGDEVILPDRTWVACAHAIILTGAKVVLVDTQHGIPIIDEQDILKKLTPRTKAIMPVHINGRSSNMRIIRDLAAEKSLSVVEDACQALYSRNEDGFLGTQSDIGCFSLGVTKLISSGQGGVAVTNDDELAQSLRLVRNHGVHDELTDQWQRLGFNFKFTDILASIGLVQLDRVSERLDHLKEIYETYELGISDLPFLKLIPVRTPKGELPLYIEVLCEERDRVKEHLEFHGIQARLFPPPLHTSSYIDRNCNFPNATEIYEAGLYLPCGPEQSMDNVNHVIEALHQYNS